MQIHLCKSQLALDHIVPGTVPLMLVGSTHADRMTIPYNNKICNITTNIQKITVKYNKIFCTSFSYLNICSYILSMSNMFHM